MQGSALEIYLAEVDAAAAPLVIALDEAVRVHLRSDVPLGVCLSGGLDSSAIVGLAASLTLSEDDLAELSGIVSMKVV